MSTKLKSATPLWKFASEIALCGDIMYKDKCTVHGSGT